MSQPTDGHVDVAADGADPALPPTQPAAAHWDGRAWTLVELPEYHHAVPAPEAHAELTEVIARAKGDVRAYGTLGSYSEDDEPDPSEQDIRLRWDGTRWTKSPNARERVTTAAARSATVSAGWSSAPAGTAPRTATARRSGSPNCRAATGSGTARSSRSG